MAKKPFWSRNVSTKSQREITNAATAIGVDARAVNILFNTFLDGDDKIQGWVEKQDVSKADLAEAKAAGVMFDPIQLNHEKMIAWVLKGRDATTPLDVSNAFVDSLQSRHMATRSALGSYAHALHLAPHPFEEDEESEGECAICGLLKTKNEVDLSARNFRRLKWAGNVEQGTLDYVGFDLNEFAKLAPISPSQEAIDIMQAVLDALRNLSSSAKHGDLGKALTGLFPSEKYERQVVLEILGYAGILAPAGWPSYFDAWVTRPELEEPKKVQSREWQFPSQGWSGKDGVNEKAIQFWFPQVA